MALKALLLRKKIDERKKRLSELEALDENLKTRGAELEAAVAELTDETPEEDRSAVEAEVEAFDAEMTAHGEAKDALSREIGELEEELAKEEEEVAAVADPAPVESVETRKEMISMKTPETRAKMFGATAQEREMFFAREDVQNYLAEIRSCIREKRALSNVGLTIPTVFLGILRENIIDYSKLYKHVTVRAINGEGRAVVMGTIPEAVWTDCCANLNDLDLGFNDVELDCWKVGGYFAVCNANLEDSDIDLASELIAALGQAIGLALDKAILYGSGTRMPMGIVTRLAQTEQPGSYPATARPWVDLHSTNIKGSISQTGANLFAQLLVNFGAAKGKYSRGEIVHVMNETTYTYLMSQALTINAAGAIVTGIGGTMPVIGGVIEVLDFVPDYNIISGYFDLYILAERAGQKFATSEHYRFLADQTVFKGTARYDGIPAIAEGFVVQAINSQSAGTSVSFAPDDANSVTSIRLNTETLSIAGTASAQLIAFTAPGAGTVTWASGTTSKATVDTSGVVTGVSAGTSTVTATCNGLTASCLVTVTT